MSSGEIPKAGKEGPKIKREYSEGRNLESSFLPDGKIPWEKNHLQKAHGKDFHLH